jgi:diguanylate cyclase (GGDEF)-like protein
MGRIRVSGAAAGSRPERPGGKRGRDLRVAGPQHHADAGGVASRFPAPRRCRSLLTVPIDASIDPGLTALAACLTGVAIGAAAAWGLLRRRGGRREAARPGRSGNDLKSLRAEHRASFGALFDHSGDPLLVCGVDGRVLACNAAAGQLLAAPPPSIVGNAVAEFMVVPPGDGPGDARPVASGEVTLRPRSGESIDAAVAVHTLSMNGKPVQLLRLRNLSGERKAQQRITHLASFDSLTGLPNRALFRDRLEQAMARSQRSGTPMALMFLDLDRFKLVNDGLGHEAGDHLLKHVAQVLSHCLRGVDTLGCEAGGEPFTLSRVGGDEFTVIAENVRHTDDAALIARRLLEALAVPFKVADEELHVSASIGISMYPLDDIDLDGMIRHADMAMYRSKSLGRNTYSFFSDDLNAAVEARVSLEGSLRHALEREQFCLHFQPKADLQTGRVSGVEALLRWHCPGRGMVPPDRFIAVLEDTGLIIPVGAWVIRAACLQLAAWDREGLPRISLAVNLSARQMRQPYIGAMVEDTLREADIDPARLEIELTESLLMEDTEVSRNVLANFARIGVRLAIDDFGTGHSSLSYLRRLDVDTLKIDRSFVNETPQDAEAAAIATAVVALGHSLQMKVVAEGVETSEQVEFLRDLGCDEMQGWHLSRPLPPADLAKWLAAYHSTWLASENPLQRDPQASGPMTLFSIDMDEVTP